MSRKRKALSFKKLEILRKVDEDPKRKWIDVVAKELGLAPSNLSKLLDSATKSCIMCGASVLVDLAKKESPEGHPGLLNP